MFHDQDFITLEQLELNNHLPNTSSFPFQLDGIHDLLFAADGALTAPVRPSDPLSDSVPLQPQTVVMRSGGGGHKRPTRKGRHSKICTAAGPRDRRMRLSIDVARSFFRLQDMLGFDKASKTVQWLLTMSKAAIKELASSVSSSSKICSSSSDRSPKSESSTLACEASSSTNKAATSAAAASKAKKTRAKKEAAKATKKPEFHSAQARELRAKARERARERTKEKQRIMTTNAINFDAIKDELGLQDSKTLLEFANDEGGQGLNTGSEEAYGYPMIGGPPPVLIPILGNGPTPPPAIVAAAAANNNTNGNIFEEQWEMEALSLYSRSLQVAFSNYPN